MNINLVIQGIITVISLIEYISSRNIDLNEKDRKELEDMLRSLNSQINSWRQDATKN